jgi:hypothetical protein
MFFSNSSGGSQRDPNRDRKRCYYKCDCGGTDYTVTLELGDRKLRRWCKSCRKFIYPIAVTHIKTAQREFRSTTPRGRP